MRISAPSIAVLAIGLSKSHAFTPPTSGVASKAASTRLSASKELSGLLQEYSGSTLPSSPQPIIPADAVVSSMESLTKAATPQPIIAAEVADSAMESLMKAASIAQDAADQAATAAVAAASAVAKSAASTKAAAVGTTVLGGVQFKPLGDIIFVQVDPSKTNPDLAFDASARARENLAILKENFLGGVKSITEGMGLGDVQLTTFSFESTNVPSIDSLSVPALVASLHLNEYGGWYAAGALAIIASQQRSAGMKGASATFESELANARAKAKEAAEAAALAAQGANTAKTLAMKMEKDLKKTGSIALLENSRSKMAQTEKEFMEKEIRALQTELATLKSHISKNNAAKEKKTVKSVKTEIEEEFPTKVTLETDPDQDGRIIDLLKLMDEENAMKQKRVPEELESKREAEAKFVASEKAKLDVAERAKSEAAEAESVRAVKEAEEKKIASEAVAAATAAPIIESKELNKGTEVSNPKAEVAKKASIKKATKGVTETQSDVPKKSTTKSSTKKTSKAATSSNTDDWATLAESTLKRKSVAQLTEYLVGRGVSVTDSAGKSLNKAELLEVVKSL